MAARRNTAREPDVAADDGPATDGHPPQDGRACVDDDVVLDDRMTRIALLQFAFRTDRKAAGTQRDRLVQAHPLSDDGGFTDHDAGAVVDEETRTDGRTR